MTKTVLATTMLLALAACTTTADAGAKERAYCEQMERRMATNHTHDHSAARGAGIDPMNVTHARCRKLLGLD
jgi:starvation-inducible outer membrane lipoprotein